MSAQELKRVIIVEDDPETRDSISLTFELGFESVQILTFDRIWQAAEAFEDFHPDLITIDLGLPDGDGLQLIRQIRKSSELPIIVLSGRGDDSTILTAIRLGADDYLVKPFSSIELQAHVEALMRRIARSNESKEKPTLVELTPRVSLDIANAQIIQSGVSQSLSAREVGCLQVLAEANGRIVPTDELKKQVWGDDSVSDSAVKMVFYRLRKSLDDGAARALIQSHRGIGYSLGI